MPNHKDQRMQTDLPERVPSLSVVIPVYNSAESLPDLIRELGGVLPSLARDFEIILVNDGSRDSSWSVLQALRAQHPYVRGIDLLRNYGQHNALLCGIRMARHEIIVTMDDDLQHPPHEIARLLQKLKEGADVVYGTPSQQQHGVWRDLASVVTKRALQSATGIAMVQHASAFRAFRTSLRDAFADYRSPFLSLDVLLTWGTVRFAAAEVAHRQRQAGRSNYTFGKLMMHAVNMMTGYSTAPLRLASLIGFTFTLFGVLVLAYVLGRYLITGDSVAGFPFLASTIAIFSGAQLFALGIIGEYLARMHFRSMDRPPYAIRQVTSDVG